MDHNEKRLLALARLVGKIQPKNEQLAGALSNELERQSIETTAKKGDSARKRYVSPEGHFKGKAGSGDRFDNCVAYQKSQGKSEESAKAICGAIARGKGYGKKGKKPGTK